MLYIIKRTNQEKQKRVLITNPEFILDGNLNKRQLGDAIKGLREKKYILDLNPVKRGKQNINQFELMPF